MFQSPFRTADDCHMGLPSCTTTEILLGKDPAETWASSKGQHSGERAVLTRRYSTDIRSHTISGLCGEEIAIRCCVIWQ